MQFFFIFWIFFLLSSGQKNNFPQANQYDFVNNDIKYFVDSLFNSLSLDERIGQLFMITANGKNMNESYYSFVDSVIINNGIGGLIFFQSGPKELQNLLKRYNKHAAIPLLTSLDAEWGLGMRLDSVEVFPWMMTLGAIQDTSLVYNFGVEVAHQLKDLGIHINFAPVLDINNNPKNPIIDRRSFGGDVGVVSRSGLAYMKGMQDNGVLACGKHFPGHGDTELDSHKGLPVMYHDRFRLDSLELKPFKDLINHGLGSIMIAHINLPIIDSSNVPSSLSSVIIQDLLKNQLNFEGLVISDALNMGALSEYSEKGEVELQAFLAGNDILLCPNNVSHAKKLIKDTIMTDHNLMEQLNNSCKKILFFKKKLGAFDSHIINDNPISLISQKTELLNRDLSKHSITILKNDSSIIPLQKIDSLKIAYVSIGNEDGDVFYDRINNYVPVDKFYSSYNSDSLLRFLNSYDNIIVGLHFNNNNFWDSHKLQEKDSVLLSQICAQKPTIVNIFGHPKILNSIPDKDASSIVLSYQNGDHFQDITAQINFGSLGASGRIPINTQKFTIGSGIDVRPVRSFGFSLPCELGMDGDYLEQIDSVIEGAIREKVMPGCQIVIARHNKIIYNKSFGYHTYDSLKNVLDSDLYDIASITKIVSGAPILMNLLENRSIRLNKKLKYFKNFSDYNDKQNIKIIDILSHQAQLHPWIPFWESFKRENKLMPEVFASSYSEEYNIEVAKNLFFNARYSDTIYKMILDYPLLEKKEYKYSDLGFYLLMPIIADIIPDDISTYVQSNFYRPIEALRITYNPLDKFLLSSIIPTERDNYFRNQLIQGYVHDQGAALFGGVGLHAGLFSNAIDLMKFMSLYLNDGIYMDKVILPRSQIEKFTRSHFINNDNRRGLVFDKPSINPDEDGPTCDSISRKSFGHSGFTGTLSWIDPEQGLIYIFLSNARVYPNGNNTKLVEKNIRTDIQEIIYKSIL